MGNIREVLLPENKLSKTVIVWPHRHGIIEFLLSADPEAVLLRDSVVFKIVPMLNPDGVFLGNYRSNYLGLDLNRHWKYPTLWSGPSIHATKGLLLGLRDAPDGTLDMYVDIHSHSTAANSFLFTNKPPAVPTPTQQPPPADGGEEVPRSEAAPAAAVAETAETAAVTEAAKTPAIVRSKTAYSPSRAHSGLFCADPGMIFPRLLEARSPDFSSFQSKSETSDPSKEGAARRAMGAELAGNGVQCYTLETSFYASHDADGRLVAYTKERYMELGRNVCRTLVDYYYLGGKKGGKSGRGGRPATFGGVGAARGTRKKSWA